MSRLVRIFGLLRIFRLARISEDIIDRFLTEGWQKMFRVLCIFSAIVWLNHIIGCTWYALGSGLFETDTGARWKNSEIGEEGENKHYNDLSDIYLYLTSFHWAMAQITLGAIELVASNSAERVFNIFLLFGGLLFSSTFVSCTVCHDDLI